MIVGFTGTRVGMSPRQRVEVIRLLQTLSPNEAHHGGCKGADADFHEVCKELGIKVVVHLSNLKKWWAEWLRYDEGDEKRPPRPPLARNGNIVLASHYLIATPREFKMITRSGTWATVRRAQWAQKPYTIVYPDGTKYSR